MSYFLDTDVCIEFLRATSVPLRARIREGVARGTIRHLSTVVFHELRYGAEKGRERALNEERLQTFIMPLEIVAFMPTCWLRPKCVSSSSGSGPRSARTTS